MIRISNGFRERFDNKSKRFSFFYMETEGI